MPLRHKFLLTLEEAEANLKEEEVETLEEAKAIKANRAKDQGRAKVKPKRIGMKNLTLSVIIARNMDIMLENVERGKENIASPMPITILQSIIRRILGI